MHPAGIEQSALILGISHLVALRRNPPNRSGAVLPPINLFARSGTPGIPVFPPQGFLPRGQVF